MQDATAAEASYRVHLRSLQDFARELAAQIDAVSRHAAGIADPATATIPLGDFGEAAALRDRHARALAEMTALLERVQSAISFAERVTGTVAHSYTQADDVAAGALARGGRV
jgi:acyl-homoserine lactone acylase PvdQ